jgi:signal transduction histidine kinase
MSLDVIESTWMEPATPTKKRHTKSESLRRRVLGEKGIGRFAASRLASSLEVVTRRREMVREVRVQFNWDLFDREDAYLDQVEVPWSESAPGEICPGGTIEDLWPDAAKPEASELTHGTILRMKGLRTSWGKDQFTSLRIALSRLVSPLLQGDWRTQGSEFQIRLELPPMFAPLCGEITPPDVLNRPHYSVRGDIKETGACALTFMIRGHEEQEQKTDRFVLSGNRPPQCGPFHIELRVWDRDARSLAELIRESGYVAIRDVRRDLDSVAGINVYRDGFRVLPYGEAGNDWLRLDARRVQNPTMRLSNNQVFGYVLISADTNPHLRDQSNREGLIEGPALDDLRELITRVLAEIEDRRYRARHPKGPRAVGEGGLFAGFDLGTIRAAVRQRHPDDVKLLTLIEDKEKDLEKRVGEVQQVLARYHRLATLGQLIDAVLHDGRAPLVKIGNEAHLGLRDIERVRTSRDAILARLAQRLRTISTQSETLATVFRRIEPFGGRRRGRPSEVRLEQIIADAFAVLDSTISEVGATVVLPDTDTRVRVDPAEIQEIIINLLQNSLHWLMQVPADRRKVVVQVSCDEAGEVEVLFSDSGPGIAPDVRAYIFDPYFSTKPDGIGLGLTIAGEIVSEYYGGTLELLDSASPPGATFRIRLRRRVHT